MRALKIFLLIFTISPLLFAQQMGTWKNYSSKTNVKDAVITSDAIWAITDGGAFSFRFADSSYTELDKASGLSSNDLTAIVIDRYGKLWFGSSEGNIDVYDPVKKVFVKRILEIYNSNRTLKQINELRAQGDTIYAATDFGLSLIDANTFFFHDTFLKFGNLASESKINSSYRDNLLYVATENGIAKQKPGTTNLSAPESWLNYTTNEGLPSNNVYKIINYRDTLLAATDAGFAFFNGTSWQRYLSTLISASVSDMEIYQDHLSFITPGGVYTYNNGILVQYSNITLTAGLSANNNLLFTFSPSGLFNVSVPGLSSLSYTPAGPGSNIFSGISVDNEGNLWAGSGTSLDMGFYKYDGTGWTNYDKRDIPGAQLGTFSRVYTSPDNSVYFMNWGDGFTRLKNNTFKVFNSSNTELSGIANNPSYIVVQGLASDSKGNLWVLTYRSSNRKPLSVLKTDSTWESFANPYRNEVLQGYDLVVDQYDTKWMVIGADISSAGEEVYYYNAERPLYSTDNSGWGVISTSNGLNTAIIYCLAIDRRGELWVGTSEGINIIYNTRQPRTGIISPEALRSQTINCITIDAINQKWVGTQEGAFVLSADGSRILEHYTTQNSPLPNDIVKSIAIDNNSGTVYFGTDFGMASLISTSVGPEESFTDLFIYPNPVYVKDGETTRITINGLIRDTEIKILNISGRLINEFTSPGGGVALWDGKDFDGKYVNSGVYLIVAYDKEGNNVATSKVAILKK